MTTNIHKTLTSILSRRRVNGHGARARARASKTIKNSKRSSLLLKNLVVLI